MAYADARHTQRNVGTVAAVAALEAGLALAIIAGLSYTYTRGPVRPPVTTYNVTPKIKPPETPKTPPKAERLVKQPPLTRDPVIDLGPAPQPSFAAKDTGGEVGLGTVAFPTPTPSPAPSFTPLKAKPRGNPGNWVTEMDYPTIAIRGEQQGRTAFRLSLDAGGKVTGCTITASSGWPVLDATTCEKLTRRARFEAAIDSTGAKTEGFYIGTVNWRLPED